MSIMSQPPSCPRKASAKGELKTSAAESLVEIALCAVAVAIRARFNALQEVSFMSVSIAVTLPVHLPVSGTL
jgi:hypothetical protein